MYILIENKNLDSRDVAFLHNFVNTIEYKEFISEDLWMKIQILEGKTK